MSVNLIPTNKDALRTWLIDLSGNIAISGAGVAFLDAQITDLEHKCSAERIRIGKFEVKPPDWKTEALRELS